MKRWPFARKHATAAAAASSASSSSAATAASPSGGVEDEFAAWYERTWPGSATTTTAAAASAAMSPARIPGSGVGSSTLKLFDKRGEYFCCYGPSALYVADTYYKTREVVKWMTVAAHSVHPASSSAARLAVVSLSPKKLSTILQREVIGRGESVEIWRKGATGAATASAADDEAEADDDEESKQSGGSGGSLGWSLLFRATPGTLDSVEEVLGISLGEAGGSAVSVAIRLAASASAADSGPAGQRIVGAAFIDPRLRSIRLLDLADDSLLAGFENALVSQSAREAFLLMPPRAGVGALAADWKRVISILAEAKIPVQQSRGPKAAAQGIGGGSKAAAAASAMLDDSAPSSSSSAAATASDEAAELQNLSSGSGPSNLSLADLTELARFVSPTSPVSLTAPGVAAAKKQSLLCLQFLLRALSIPIPEEDRSRFTIAEVRLHDVCRLDHSAVQALSLFPRGDETDRSMSLFGILDRTRSAMGSRLLATFIRQPLMSRDKIVARQDYVELFSVHASLREQLRDNLFRAMPDLGRLGARFQKRTANLSDVMAFYELGCVKLARIRDALVEFAAEHPGYASSVATPSEQELKESEAREGQQPSPLRQSVLDRLHAEFVVPLSAHIDALSPFANMVEQAVQAEDDAAVAAGDEMPGWERRAGRVSYIINPAIHPTLAAIAAARTEARAGLDREFRALHSVVWSASGETVSPKLAFNPLRDFGFHARLTKTEMKRWNGGEGMGVPGGTQGIRVLEQRKDGLHFTTRRLEKWSQQLSAVRKEFATASEQLLNDVLATTATYTPVLDAVSDLLAALDVYSTLAFVALQAPTPWIRPRILPRGSGLIDLRQARHACMEVVATSASGQFIPNDVSMRRGQSHLQIITGPNMGGKSSYCRTAGLCVLMAQMGCSIPAAAGSTISVVDSILSRIGAGDSTARAQSTFMIEMLEASALLRQSTRDSLVIIDELGRGTSTDDGFGIAWAIAEHLARDTQCFTLFASHYAEITALEQQQPGVVNRHVTVAETPDSLVMLYALADGPADRSYGIHVARLAHFPTRIIEDATRYAEGMEKFKRRSGHTSGEEEKQQEADSSEPISEQQMELLIAFQTEIDDGTANEATMQGRLHAFQQSHAAQLAAASQPSPAAHAVSRSVVEAMDMS